MGYIYLNSMKLNKCMDKWKNHSENDYLWLHIHARNSHELCWNTWHHWVDFLSLLLKQTYRIFLTHIVMLQCGQDITHWLKHIFSHKMTSPNGNIFGVTGLLCGEFTDHRWIPLTKASNAEFWCFLWSAPDSIVERTMETPVIWDAIALMMTSL